MSFIPTVKYISNDKHRTPLTAVLSAILYNIYMYSLAVPSMYIFYIIYLLVPFEYIYFAQKKLIIFISFESVAMENTTI